jgi:hypothetical protein
MAVAGEVVEESGADVVGRGGSVETILTKSGVYPHTQQNCFGCNIVVELRTFYNLNPVACVSFCLLRVKSREIRIRLFSLEDFPGTQPGGFANPDLTQPIFDPSRR